MPLNKQTGNMYPFVTHTWNPIRGQCPHDCSYCYMKVFPQKPLRFVEEEMKTNLGVGNFIFVGSSTDMWAFPVPYQWIEKTLSHCFSYANQYLFQTKNPARFKGWDLDARSILGTTIETNRGYQVSKAPSTLHRMEALRMIPLPKMVSIEPVMDFDLDVMLRWIALINPEFVSIGADSKGHKLPEPSPEKLKHLIAGLKDITEVKLKDNLKRLLKEGLSQ